MSGYVLVPGACHGGWWYQSVADRLRGAGHQAEALTLAGLGPEGMDGLPAVNLDTHVEQTVEAVTRIAQLSGAPAILVGHSYGGSVITGAADRAAGQVRALVYLDAFVPDDGDSCWSMTNDEQRRWYIEGAAATGLAVAPLPFFDPRARPHPLATLVQRSTLSGAWKSVADKTYALATAWPSGESPFPPTATRLERDPEWTVLRWETRHNVLFEGPQRLVDLLLEGHLSTDGLQNGT